MNERNFNISLKIVALLLGTLLSGMISISKNEYQKFDNKLFASPHEVTNKEYREFLRDLKSTGQNDKFIKYLYDSTQWVKKFSAQYNEPMVKTYHSHPAYDNYPIVNITKEAAEAFCEWQTDKYNKSSKKKYIKVLFRLPTETEWKKLAAPLPGNNLPWYGNLAYKSGEEKIALANIKVRDYVTDKDNYIFDGGLTTLIVGHYKANNLGIYDVIGNVAEIIQSNVQKGGSWDNYLEECAIDKSQNYKLPDPRVGFRVIMQVIEE